MPRREAQVGLFDVVQKFQVEGGVLITKLDNVGPRGDSVATPALYWRRSDGLARKTSGEFVALLLSDGIVPIEELGYLKLRQTRHLFLHGTM